MCSQFYVQRDCIQTSTASSSILTDAKRSDVQSPLVMKLSIDFGDTELTLAELYCECSKEAVKHGYRLFSVNQKSNF